MEPWYKVATPRKEVREGRSFNPDEFAIALEQVVAGTAPEDYRDPAQFFARTCFTRALREHAGMVLRRLSGKTENTAPVLTLITQFGGGKTHTLTTLYHLAKSGDKAAAFTGVSVFRQVIKRGKRVRLAAAELGDQREHRRGVVGSPGEPAQHHARMLAQCPSEAGAREELRSVAIVLRRRPGHDLLEGDGELVRVERAAFADFLARCGDLVPGIKSHM